MTITNEDNMELMARYEDNYFDLAIVDPPYGINIQQSGGTPKHLGFKVYDKKFWDKKIPDKQYFDELFRVSKNQIVWGGNYFSMYLPSSMGWVFWDKGQNLTMSDGELAFSSFQKALRRIIINRCEIKKDGAIHPTQKPIKLYEWLLMNYAKEGDKILDTHLGSGSIAIACHNLGYDLTACELDKDYYNAAIKRIEQHRAQQRLF
jgi:site-specific DNA-methyltransferase (adenine-specific)